MRSSAALVYNCKQARIVLAGTSFATTKNSCKREQNVNLFILCRAQPNFEVFRALAFLRSAELARSIQRKLKTEGFFFLLACSFQLPPPAGTPSYLRWRVFSLQNNNLTYFIAKTLHCCEQKRCVGCYIYSTSFTKY